MADGVTKELCEERSGNIINSVNELKKTLDTHCEHIDITFGEIFKLLKEKNNSEAYNRGVADTANKIKRASGLSTKVTIALIGLANVVCIGIIELIKILVK